MATISFYDYVALNQAQKEMVKILGIKVQDPPKKRWSHKRPSCPEEYTLQVNTTCSLCRTKVQSYFRMFKTKDHLQGIKLAYIRKADKTTEQTVTTCKYCYEHLRSLPKETLIKRYIKLYRKSINT